MFLKPALMITLQLGASGVDAYYTERNASHPTFHENNPIAAPFMGSRSSRIAYFSVTTGVKIAIPRILRRHKHNRLATAAELFGITDNAYCAAQSARRESR